MNLYEYQRSRSFIDLVQGHSVSTFSNFFSLETAVPVETKFHLEPPCDEGAKDCSNGPGHLSNMAAMPIYVKTLKIFSGTKRPMTLKLCMQHWVFEYYQFCSNDGTGMILTYFTAKSNLVPFAFIWGIRKRMDFSETTN